MEKKTFVLETDHITEVNMLSDEQAGKLFKAIYAYEAEGEVAQFSCDMILNMLFGIFKRQLDFCRKRYEEKVKKCSEAGKRGGRPRKETKAEKGYAFSEKHNDNVNVNDNVNENDNDNVNVNVSVSVNENEKENNNVIVNDNDSDSEKIKNSEIIDADRADAEIIDADRADADFDADALTEKNNFDFDEADKTESTAKPGETVKEEKAIKEDISGYVDIPETGRPTAEQVRIFCESKGKPIDAEKFVWYYAQRGWKIGAELMRSWKATALGWWKRDEERRIAARDEALIKAAQKSTEVSPKEKPDSQSSFDMDELEEICMMKYRKPAACPA